MALSLDVDIIIVLCIVLSFIGLCLAIILWQLIRRGYVGRTVKVNVKGDGTQRFEINDLFNSTDPSDRGMSQHERGVRSIQVAWEDISVGPLLGKGSFGVVYKAKYRGSDVAVKTLLDQSLHARVLKEFESECMIFAELRHPNLILFMGVVTTVPHLSIVTELLPNGALSNVLMDERIFIDVGRRLQMALDICLGMAYLHTNKPPIIHRDLKSPNILVDSNFTLKIGDFGLAGLVAAEPLIADPDVPECSTMSVVPDEVSSSATLPVFSERSRTSHRFLSKIFMNGSEPGPSDRNVTGIELHAVAIPMQEDTSFRVPEPAPPPKPKNKFAGTIMWAAPEVLRLEGCTKSSDIYSFGIVLWELAMRKKPYEDMHPLSVRYQVMRQGARPTPLPEATNSIRDLMESCWAEKVEDRPESFVAIAKQIEKYRDDEGFSQDLASLGRTTSTGLSSVYNSNASDAPSLFHGMDIIRAGVLLACVVEPTTPVNYLKILEEARKTLDSVVESATSEYTCHVEKISRNKFLGIFEDPVDSLCWALSLQDKLLDVPWKDELLEEESFKVIPSEQDKARTLYKGLRLGVFMSFSKTIEKYWDAQLQRTRYRGTFIDNILNFANIASTGRVLIPRELFQDSIEDEMDMDILHVRDGGTFQTIPLLEILPIHMQERYHHPSVPKLQEQTLATQTLEAVNTSSAYSQILSHMLLNENDVTFTDMVVRQEKQTERVPLVIGYWLGMKVWLRRKIDEVGRSDSSVLLTEQAKIVLRVRHPQIAAFLGFIMNPVITFVYESFQNGPLSTFLFDLSHPLTMRCRFEMALDIATGMHYLHNCQPHVVHLNITRHSVFVTRKYEAKLGDFTTAVSMGSQSDEKRYKQECLADIQALGKLLFELIAREEWNVVRFKALVEQCTALDRPSEVVEDTAPPPPLSTPPDSAGKSALVRRSINADGDHADCKARGPTVNHPEKGEACTEQVEGISSIQRERLPPTEVDALMREPSCATREAVRMAVQLIEACVFASDTVDSEPIKSARVVNRLEKIIMSLGDT